MKSLKESIFDKDNVKKDVEFGVIYKLSEEYAHYNGFSNDPWEFIDLFKGKELKRIGRNYKYVDKDSNFINYWENIYGASTVGSIVDIILRCPAEIFMNKNTTEKKLKEYLKDYIHRLQYEDISVFIRRFESHEMIEVTIYDDIKSSQPNSIKLTFEKI